MVLVLQNMDMYVGDNTDDNADGTNETNNAVMECSIF